MTDPVYIRPDVEAALTEMANAEMHFELLKRRPRDWRAWRFVVNRLWSARAEAMSTGVIKFGSARYLEIGALIGEACKRSGARSG